MAVACARKHDGSDGNMAAEKDDIVVDVVRVADING